jgi:hypothetical protein
MQHKLVCRVMVASAVAAVTTLTASGAAPALAAPPVDPWLPPESTWVWDGGTDTFTEFDAPVDVVASLRHGDPSLGATFERTGVTVGDGVELDETDLVENPGESAGAVSVDIDQDAGSITVTVIEVGCVSELAVIIRYDGPTTLVAPVTDDLFGGAEGVELLAEAGIGVFHLTWTVQGDTCVELGPVGSSTTFDYALLILAYYDFGPGKSLPTAGSDSTTSMVAFVVVLLGLVTSRLATRRPARTR